MSVNLTKQSPIPEKDFIALNNNSKFKNVFTKANYQALTKKSFDRKALSLECRILLLQIEKPEMQYVLRDAEGKEL